jgi:hypothetical protein
MGVLLLDDSVGFNAEDAPSTGLSGKLGSL